MEVLLVMDDLMFHPRIVMVVSDQELLSMIWQEGTGFVIFNKNVSSSRDVGRKPRYGHTIIMIDFAIIALSDVMSSFRIYPREALPQFDSFTGLNGWTVGGCNW